MLIIGIKNSLQEELWGVRVGLCLAKSLGIRQLVSELDALLVVQSLQRPLEKNHPLDHLVSLAQNNERGLVHLEMAPASFEPLLHKDTCGDGVIRI
ncbi:hypothetical protein Goshw_022110 [Gossypium schwendimanii]|uniref:RNase H type-1 domain-containing protein n=1 Tax=Gossypium schwendimanii TaxID=34291 RepID=A0A7J9NBB6_GOSSC|nr:hypothetical protein [Gossypium schwendimanii]